jgi:O-antigen biosynthesis protein
MSAMRAAGSRVFRSLAPQLARRLRPHVAYSPESVSIARREVPLSHPLFQITESDLAASRAATAGAVTGPPTTVTWLVPHFWHAAFGGIYTIFRFISGFADHGVRNQIVIYDRADADVDGLRRVMAMAFPNLSETPVHTFDIDGCHTDLPPADIGICTLWPSAYVLLRFNAVARKYYFVQDYEPLFYPAGPTSALAESTYRFGFKGLVNTPGLLAALEQRHGMQGTSFVPAVDARYTARGRAAPSRRPIRIFFYTRPANPRNSFALCVVIMEQLLARYGGRIEIVTAGAEWDEAEYGLKNRITNLGLLDGLDAVSELYRSCNIGVVYMLSKHPSYQPLEFMASGVATVTNRNEDNVWLLRHEENCLLAEPSPAAMTEQISRLVEDPGLLRRIQEAGIATVGHDWKDAIEGVWQAVASDSG